jgi:hypothetical protein
MTNNASERGDERAMPDQRSSKKAFVIMPFATEFQDAYNELIKKGLEDAGFATQRADNIASLQNILRDIVNNIANADLVVADLTGLNANVLYELGIAHGLRKPTIMLTQSVDTLPFDLRSYRVVSYSLNFKEASALREQLREIAVNQYESMHTGVGSGPVDDFLVITGNVEQAASAEQTSQQPKQQAAEPESEQSDPLSITRSFIKSFESVDSGYTSISMGLSQIYDKMRAYEAELEAVPNRRAEIAFQLSRELMNICSDLDAFIPELKKYFELLPDKFSSYFSQINLVDEKQQMVVKELIDHAGKLQAVMRASKDPFSSIPAFINRLADSGQGVSFAAREFEQRCSTLLELSSSGEAYLARIEELLASKFPTVTGEV